MTYQTVTSDFVQHDPLETFEYTARRSDMEAERVDDTELHVSLSGSWREVVIWFAWRIEAQVVQVATPLEMRVPKARAAEVHRLLSMINERLWLGHFDIWQEDGSIVYRNAVVLPEGQALESSQAEIVIRGALDAFERFYPAFNYVVWGDKTSEEALEAAICETAGRA